jgi:hypothetical protein
MSRGFFSDISPRDHEASTLGLRDSGSGSSVGAWYRRGPPRRCRGHFCYLLADLVGVKIGSLARVLSQ